MTFWDFASGSPYLATFIVFLVIMLVRSASKSIVLAWNRWLRSRNIRAHGWPRAPVDADGDLVYPATADAIATAVVKKIRDERTGGTHRYN
jgi:hypothetical protein